MSTLKQQAGIASRSDAESEHRTTGERKRALDGRSAPREMFDVVVVGGGGTGLAASLEARSLGRSVVLLEKNPQVGGTTAWSVGSISASNTPHQRRAGILDSPEDHVEDMIKFAAHDKRFGENGELAPQENPALRRLLVENVTSTIPWLMSKGVVFFGPMPEAPHRKPRMHNIVPNSRAYIYHLERHAIKDGVDIRVNHQLVRLIRDGDRVIGALCQAPDGSLKEFIARGGVVLATGDYSANPEMKAHYISEEAARIPPVNPTSTGDGQRIATEIGARVLNGHLSFFSLRFVAPTRKPLVQKIPPWPFLMRFMVWALANLPQKLLRPFILGYVTTFLVPELGLLTKGGMLVNNRGQRFIEETERPEMALLEQPDQCGYVIMDDATAKKFSAWPHFVSTAPGVAFAYLPDYRRNRPDIYASAPTIRGLADKLGIPAAALEKTLEKYNASAPGKNRPQLLKGPFHSLGPIKNMMGFSDGGLAINDKLQVVDQQDRPIPGLFAAGSAGQGGLLLLGHGNHLGWGFTSGRIAGRNAAYQATTADAAS
ncbi:MAG TPA: FAD-dependent oxidoreductase [Ramlibacter sp.]|nr:FAD-dependent oxidoreductase [Ramlibacter sp.]